MFLRKVSLALALGLVPLASQPLQEPAKPQDAAKEVLTRFLAVPRERMMVRQMAMDVDINAALPKLKKSGAMRGVRKVDAAGVVSYEKLEFSGDEQIKKDIILRYLTGEREAQSRNLDVDLHEKNYEFNYKARLVLDNKAIYVFKVEPRRKADGLFKGEIWVDGETALRLREIGRLVRNPSIFFKKTEINRRYEIKEDRPHLAEMQMQIDTRLVGRVEMQVRYANYAPATPPVVAEPKPAY